MDTSTRPESGSFRLGKALGFPDRIIASRTSLICSLTAHWTIQRSVGPVPGQDTMNRIHPEVLRSTPRKR